MLAICPHSKQTPAYPSLQACHKASVAIHEFKCEFNSMDCRAFLKWLEMTKLRHFKALFYKNLALKNSAIQP